MERRRPSDTETARRPETADAGDTHVAGPPPSAAVAEPAPDTTPDPMPVRPAAGEAATRPGLTVPSQDRRAAGPPEAESPADAERPGAGPADAERPGPGRTDTAQLDTTQPDASRPDTSRPDTARPDTVRPDASRPEGALSETSRHETPGTPAASPVSKGAEGDPLLAPSEADGFREKLRVVQAGFVDDPAEAVRKADALASDVTEAIARALAGRRTALAEPLNGGKDGPDTERLRLALRGYRDLLDRVLTS